MLRILMIGAPLLMMPLFWLALQFELTARMTRWMVSENRPVEMLTFLFGAVGGIGGLIFARRLRAAGAHGLVVAFYGLFALLLFFVAMEEIAWGQQLFKFSTPEAWREINVQGETTLHNLAGMQGNNGYLRAVFGLGGLVGVALNLWPRFRPVAPPTILLSWFLVIAVHSLVRIATMHTVPVDSPFDVLLRLSAEVIELMIVFAASVFLYTKSRELLPS